MKIYATLLGILLIVYGALNLTFGLSQPNVMKNPRLCAAWLCPEEFTAARVDELTESAGQSPGAIVALKRAVLLDPASAYAWASFGNALVNIRQLTEARYCFDRALAAGPRNPAILMQHANFAFRESNVHRTFQDLSVILRNPDLTAYYQPVFLTYVRLGVPIQEVLQSGIPAQPEPAQAFLRFLMEANEISGAEAAWGWITHKHLSDNRLTNDYLDFLIRSNQSERAAETWASLNTGVAPEYRKTNFVFNGDFAHAPKLSPFDWHIEASDDVKAERVSGQCQSGSWCLKLNFEGQDNVDFHQVFEETALAPGRWQLRAIIRTDGITTDQGVRMRATGRHVDVTTEAVGGTSDWTRVEQAFEVKEPALIRVEVARQASRRFDNKISGSALIASVELSPIH